MTRGGDCSPEHLGGAFPEYRRTKRQYRHSEGERSSDSRRNRRKHKITEREFRDENTTI